MFTTLIHSPALIYFYPVRPIIYMFLVQKKKYQLEMFTHPNNFLVNTQLYVSVVKGDASIGFFALDALTFESASCLVSPDWADPSHSTPSPTTEVPPGKEI